MDARELIEERLGKLGALGSPDQIRDFFVEKRVTGQAGHSGSCVVARYLLREMRASNLLHVSYFAVNSGGITFRTGASAVDATFIKVVGPVSDLICAFDEHQYPELEE